MVPHQTYDFATLPWRFAAAFNGGRLTSDGGLAWLAAVDTDLGLCAALAADLLAEAERERTRTQVEKVRRLSESSYQADSWEQPRRVIIKAEGLPKGPNLPHPSVHNSG